MNGRVSRVSMSVARDGVGMVTVSQSKAPAMRPPGVQDAMLKVLFQNCGSSIKKCQKTRQMWGNGHAHKVYTAR